MHNMKEELSFDLSRSPKGNTVMRPLTERLRTTSRRTFLR